MMQISLNENDWLIGMSCEGDWLGVPMEDGRLRLGSVRFTHEMSSGQGGPLL